MFVVYNLLGTCIISKLIITNHQIESWTHKMFTPYRFTVTLHLHPAFVGDAGRGDSDVPTGAAAFGDVAVAVCAGGAGGGGGAGAAATGADAGRVRRPGFVAASSTASKSSRLQSPASCGNCAAKPLGSMA